jgi:hypothetical protein
VQGREIFRTGVFACKCGKKHELDAYLKEKGFASDAELPERCLVRRRGGPQAILVGGGEPGDTSYDRSDNLATVGWLK